MLTCVTETIRRGLVNKEYLTQESVLVKQKLDKERLGHSFELTKAKIYVKVLNLSNCALISRFELEDAVCRNTDLNQRKG